MKYIVAVFLFVFIFIACSSPGYKNPHIVIKTDAGNIEVELYPDKAPKTVAAFLSYIDSGYYKNALFYRVLNRDNQPSDAFKAELIQGGIYKSNYKIFNALPGIPHETTKQTGILHTN